MKGKTRIARLIISLVMIVLVLLFAASYFYDARLVTGSSSKVKSVTVNQLTVGTQQAPLQMAGNEAAAALFASLAAAETKREVSDSATFTDVPRLEIVIGYDDRTETVLLSEDEQSLYRIMVIPGRDNDYKLVYVVSADQVLIKEIIELTMGNDEPEDSAE